MPIPKYFKLAYLRHNGVHKNWTKKLFRGRELKNEQSKGCPSYTRHSKLLLYMFLTYIIKLPQTLWELWAAQVLGFRGDKYVMKKARVVSLTRDKPTGPYLCIYQILSEYEGPSYFTLSRSYGVHKNLAKEIRSWGDNLETEARVVLFYVTLLLYLI